jgi:glycosyltransferase involved in cell wall biosynthesis
LVPSLVEETSSLVAREALAAGTPVIAFPRRALVELVEHGRNGYLADDVEQMADCIAELDTIDRESCRSSASRFPLSRMVDCYFTLYRRLARTPAAMTC